MSFTRVLGSTENLASIADLLRADYDTRFASDPQLSIRKYGQRLNIDPSTISQIMRGQRRVSSRQAQLICRELGLAENEIHLFVEREVATPATLRTEDNQAFQAASDWRYDAVLELLAGQPHQTEHLSLARSLRLTPTKLNLIIDDLCAAGLLEVVDGKWQDRAAMTTSITSPAETTATARAYQKSVALSSIEAIETLDPLKRNHTSLLLKINESDLPAIAGYLKQSRRALVNDFNKSDRADTKLYALQIALFPVESEENLS